MKRCARCTVEKDETEFGRDGGRKDGLAIYCKACRVARYVKELGAGRIIRDGKLVQQPPATAICEKCQTEFRPRLSRQRFCSRSCASRAREWVPQPGRKRSGNRLTKQERPCVVCGKVFAPWTPEGKFCSRDCKSKATVGTRYFTKEGYVLVKVAKGTPGAFKNNWMSEHRVVLAEKLGRPLTDEESVHHVNGDKSDNRPENLQVRQGKHGSGVHYRCKDCGSHNVEPIDL